MSDDVDVAELLRRADERLMGRPLTLLEIQEAHEFASQQRDLSDLDDETLPLFPAWEAE